MSRPKFVKFNPRDYYQFLADHRVMYVNVSEIQTVSEHTFYEEISPGRYDMVPRGFLGLDFKKVELEPPKYKTHVGTRVVLNRGQEIVLLEPIIDVLDRIKDAE